MLPSELRTSVGFQFVTPLRMLMLQGIGWEINSSENYIWDGKRRKDEHCLFQYTVSGGGEIEIQRVKYSLKQGDAFIVDIPGDHCYRLPPSSPKWEVLYVELSKEALPFLRQAMALSGPVFELPDSSPVVELAWDIYDKAIHNKIQDTYENSTLAYIWLMELTRHVSQNHVQPVSMKIEQCKQFIEQHYMEPIGLEDMAEVAGQSKFHFSREYERRLGITPVRHLTEVRLAHAVKLMMSTECNLEEIARKSGFSNANYFGKVFRKHMGVSPGIFRQNNTYAIQHVFHRP
ncbi:helix-turn-helix domain-containing protein [Paenibacillus segetis]|uniref:HTH araC/xylS-type domain-containing protein n=1 Tax=Paenibacillus segetis TaxID=1325360 RepID=A0ABQ1YIT3_9BACL|nr:helix-turn-helix domain-containing protein [Paenibacillus segetis]GGH27498.1 hypothetical protein GCM10008013_28990 [Paenibacillus segetis]